MTVPVSKAIPTQLLTRRLMLRPCRAGDGELLFPALQESVVALREFLGHLSWVAAEPTPQLAESRCLECAAAFDAGTELTYLAFEQDSGRLVGSAGLPRIDWQVPRTEVGYWMRSSACGNGYASECVDALTRWALETMGAQRVELVTDALNLASRRVAERCGFELEAVLRHMARARDGSLRDRCIYARFPAAAAFQKS